MVSGASPAICACGVSVICCYADMKRTTIMLPDDLAYLLDLERRRRDQSTAEIVRRALEAYLSAGGMRPKRLRFAALGASGHRETARQADAVVTPEWRSDKFSGSSLRRR